MQRPGEEEVKFGGRNRSVEQRKLHPPEFKQKFKREDQRPREKLLRCIHATL